MAADAFLVSPLHELRGHFNTIRLSARVLDLETDLTKAGHLALKRIHNALVGIERELERMERTRTDAAMAYRLIQGAEPD